MFKIGDRIRCMIPDALIHGKPGIVLAIPGEDFPGYNTRAYYIVWVYGEEISKKNQCAWALADREMELADV